MKRLFRALAILAAAGALLATVQPSSACGDSLQGQRIEATGLDAALLDDGSVWVLERPGAAASRSRVKLALLRDIVQLASQGRQLYARQADGRVWQWTPESVALPRPVRGLSGKAIDLVPGDDGRLVVRVMRHELDSDVGRLVEREVALNLSGSAAIRNVARYPVLHRQFAATR